MNNENNKKELEEFINYSINNIDSKYKSALYIILKQCIEDTGLIKNDLIEKLKTMYKNSEIENLSNKSIVNKQFLKNFILLNEETRSVILDEIIQNLNIFETKNGLIELSTDLSKNNVKATGKKTEVEEKRIYKTSDKNIILELSPEYVQSNVARLSFYAKYGEELDIKIRTFHYNSIYYEDREYTKKYKDYKDIYESKLLKSYINLLKSNVENIKPLNPQKTENLVKKVKYKDGLRSEYFLMINHIQNI